MGFGGDVEDSKLRALRSLGPKDGARRSAFANPGYPQNPPVLVEARTSAGLASSPPGPTSQASEAHGQSPDGREFRSLPYRVSVRQGGKLPLVLAKLSAFLRGQGPCWSCSCRQGPCNLGSLAARMEMSCVAHTPHSQHELSARSEPWKKSHHHPTPETLNLCQQVQVFGTAGQSPGVEVYDSGARVVVGPFEPGKLVGSETPFV